MGTSSASGRGAPFTVVVNHEESYSVWETGKPLPEAWRATEVTGTKEECVAYVNKMDWEQRLKNREQRLKNREQGTS